ncbi:uncharacterized protein LOC113780842 [Coffea eugenioides]|uniref:uncharacterized protein LOC113756094 n=1 Tax=Coffea eugenioides TaxID=49369 RepID=UPI000F6145DC|nr:uncharacterized protein LOC113756094 [Coffea eugenioides]XP_027174264.1 uncharacterized protein LOC113773859 [Coffea eugenioides]XP_027182426.1 uncharacterized protein LOC113780842 [Coffea eugenioides]
MVEFVADNPNIFEELGRYFKRQGKEKAESSKRRPTKSPEVPSGEDSDEGHLSRSTSRRASSKATSKIASIFRAFSRGLLRKRADDPPRRPGGLVAEYLRAPPFTDDINGEMVPPNFKLPALRSYDGRGDPEVHLRAFLSAFRLYCVPDAVICRAFPIFLQGTARKWFWGLEPRSISSLDELIDRFIHRFVSSRPITNTSAYLLNLQQAPSESLRSYLQRFDEENVQIPDQNEQVTIAAFTNGLIAGIFNTEIHRDYPRTLRELWDRVDQGIRNEDLNRMKREAQATRTGQDSRRKKDAGRAEQGPSGSSSQFRDRRSVFDRIVKGRSSTSDVELTPLNSIRTHVLAVMRQNHLGRTPPEIPGRRDKRNSNLYCAYHRDVGHETEDCNDLKREIENLIRQGYLKQFVRKNGGFNRSVSHRENRGPRREDRRDTNMHCRGPEDRREDKQPPRDGSPGYGPNIAGVINTIAGGPTGGDSQNSRKRTYRQAGMEVAEPSSRLSEVITYGPTDPVPAASSNHEALVIEVLTNNYTVKKVYVDPESSVDVLYYRTFESLKLTREQLTPVRTLLVGFGGHVVHPEGMVSLMVTVGRHPRCRTIPVNFAVVKADSPYNMLIGRPTLNALRAVYSTYHLSFKFPTPAGVAEVSSDVSTARECYLATIQAAVTPRTASKAEEKRPAVLSKDCIDPQKAGKPGRLEPGDEVEQVVLNEARPDQVVQVGAGLPSPLKEEMICLIKDHRDVFAWSADEVVGVPPELMVHQFNVNPQARPVKQKRRHFGPERSKAISDEVDKLLPAKMIHEVQYPTWLSNPVMVKNDTSGRRMCVDFTDLNKACPKDCYPLPRIDALLDSAMGHEILCFLDAFKGYHQIGMSEEDQEKTAFYTDKGVYCYTTMPFGLKNARATYQRLINRLFKDQIGRNVEAYVDDILVKSLTTSAILSDVREVFGVLRDSRMKLNPKKCVFGVTSGKFLGYLVSHRGIEANPDKVKAIQDMSPPRNLREVQRLNGRLAALNRFLSQSAEKALPFFKVLKKTDQFAWTEECQVAFDKLKQYLHHLPTLASPRPEEKLYLYLSAADEAVSAVLIRDEGTQVPVYYPLRQILVRPEASGRLTKWAVKLGEYDLSYEPRTAIKAQALADFLAELTFTEGRESTPALAEVSTQHLWTLYVDGSSNGYGSGAGLLLEGPQGEVCSCALRFDFPATNNESEYEALITGLQLVRKLGAQRIHVRSDSQLVVCQVLGEYEAKDETMQRYLSKVHQLIVYFESFEIQRIPHSQNRRADALSRLASTSFSDLNKTVLVEMLSEPGYMEEVACPVNTGETWMSPFILFLGQGVLPEDRAEARKIQRKSTRYALRDGELYKRSCLGPWLRCVTPEAGRQVLHEIHEGLCGAHVGHRMLARKTLLLGYFWPSVRQDAQNLILSCPSCQVHAPELHQLSNFMVPITSPWPFEQWGTDIIGPFPKAVGSYTFLVTAVDYFTKWVEAEPLRNITGLAVQKFFWKCIVCRFGIPQIIISDNGRQFAENPFKAWCQNLGIKQHFTSVGHPQANGQAENFNRTLLHGLKTRLHRAGSSWVEELPSVLWSYRTTPRSSTQETPFSLTYGAEAVIPAEILTPSPRLTAYVAEENGEERQLDLDLIDEKRDLASARIASYKNTLTHYNNTRVKHRQFLPGDLVLRKNSVSRAEPQGKLGPKWEGPYRVVEYNLNGYCKLSYRDGSLVPRTWHVENLRLYYV